MFKKYFKSLTYCSPLILAELVKLTQSNKLGLGMFQAKVLEAFKNQNEELKSSKKEIYNKVLKVMAFECPLYIYPCSSRLSGTVLYEDISPDPAPLAQASPLQH